MSKVKFNNKDNAFYLSLKTSVDEYFEKTGQKKTGDWRLFSKTFILVGVAIACYCLLIFINKDLGTIPALLLASLLGFTLSGIGFSVMHDANHGSYSTREKLNDLIGLSANAMGASAYFWKQKHNIIHHTYTNIDGIDDDIAKSPIIRQCESQKWVPAHRFQHLYINLVYCLTSLFWLFIMDFTKYFTHKIYTTPAWKLTLKNHLIFWVTKVMYILFYVVIPAMVWGWLPWLVGFLVMHATLGIMLSIVFQLAHVVENTEFEHIGLNEDKHFETAWAEHQLKTTSNFAMNNKAINWFVGGLNFQVEHHLFPKISHIHYPAISKILMQKCKEFNMPYNYYPGFFQAIASHYRFMKFLGKKPAVAQAQLQAA
jgi:linoleoyl-CoA desaturase